MASWHGERVAVAKPSYTRSWY